MSSLLCGLLRFYFRLIIGKLSRTTTTDQVELILIIDNDITVCRFESPFKKYKAKWAQPLIVTVLQFGLLNIVSIAAE
jgi:hypothetical protein